MNAPPRTARPIATLLEGILRVPLLAKLAGANLIIVASALFGVMIERRLSSTASAVSILGIALGVSLVVNLVLVYVALQPLNDLEATATRLSTGDMSARVPASVLADRDMARVGTTLNALLDRLTEDRARERQLAALVISAQDEERARVARELHDSTAQILTAVMLQLGAAARESTSPPLDARIATLRELTAEALEEVRSMSHTMHPRVLDDLGLAAALEWLARKTGAQEPLDVHVAAVELDPPLSPPLAAALYRVAQEALRNVARHADARHVNVRLRREREVVLLEVGDDGRGFDVASAEKRRPGMGLFSMRERIGLVNGHLLVKSAPGQGTTVVATVPFGN
ncbi:MAG: sensor histidine kinase [Gemmatimonadota bacterium]